MSELSEFGVALSRMMDRRAIGFPGLAAVLAERGYHGVSEDGLRDYVEGREPVPGSLPPFLVEALGLTLQEENEYSPLPLRWPDALSYPRRSHAVL